MKNIEFKVDEKKQELTIKIDLSQKFGKSTSGKTTIVASTQGNVEVPGFEEYRIGVNCYTK